MDLAIPSDDLPDALSALRSILPSAESVSVACAFVTDSGVDVVKDALEGRQIPIEICARGAPITEQAALLRLRDELGASVSAVMGPHAVRFHPKLWLVRTPITLYVLSGSGNLTRGGLTTNIEQFELLEMPLDSQTAEEQERRFAALVGAGIPLGEIETSPAWYEWASQVRARNRIADQLKALDDVLASRRAAGREADKRLLCSDLYALYERTVAARLPRADGRAYVPNYFKRGLDAACAANNPVPLVARICDRQTEGFDVILEHGSADLTVEALVVDASKPYHDLFGEETRRLAAERLRLFAN